ncbi:MAG: protein rep [Pseudanabaena sp.]
MCKRKALLSTKLQSFSDRDKVWEKHKVNGELVATHYADSQFPDYSRRIALCGESLDFELVDDQLKLKNTWFCRVRHCPICQWRRSLKWKAKAYAMMPKVVEDFPKARWLFVTLTVKNCEIADLRETITWMHEAFKRMSKLKAFPAKGWIKATEVTMGQDGLAHPHFHCLLMVSPSYFSGAYYLSKERWGSMWQQSLRADYAPIIDIRAVQKRDDLAELIPEILKYQTKESDLTADREWLLELTQQLHKTRAIAIGGVLRDYMRELANEPEDLTDEVTGEQGEEDVLTFSWHGDEKHYILDN